MMKRTPHAQERQNTTSILPSFSGGGGRCHIQQGSGFTSGSVLMWSLLILCSRIVCSRTWWFLGPYMELGIWTRFVDRAVCKASTLIPACLSSSSTLPSYEDKKTSCLILLSFISLACEPNKGQGTLWESRDASGMLPDWLIPPGQRVASTPEIHPDPSPHYDGSEGVSGLLVL